MPLGDFRLGGGEVCALFARQAYWVTSHGHHDFALHVETAVIVETESFVFQPEAYEHERCGHVEPRFVRVHPDADLSGVSETLLAGGAGDGDGALVDTAVSLLKGNALVPRAVFTGGLQAERFELARDIERAVSYPRLPVSRPSSRSSARKAT
jgi:hypothetical protein